MAEPLAVADIVGVHGIRGWVKLKLRVEDMALLQGFDSVAVVPGPKQPNAPKRPSVKVKQVRSQARSVIAQLGGIDDRSSAEALRGYQLVVASDALPAPADDEYFWRDLVGLAVWCRDPSDADAPSVLIGEVDYLLETGANDVVVVKATEASVDARERLIPWLPGDVITEVDVEAGVLRVDWHLDD